MGAYTSKKGVMMANRKDWIPGQEEKMLEMMTIWKVKLADTKDQGVYLWPDDECTAVINGITAFEVARTAYQAVPTGANRVAKDEAKKAVLEGIRKFARERIRNNPKMTDAQKQELGITISDRELSPVPVPNAGPESEAEISAKAPGVVKARYLGAKPYGVDRVEIAWSLSDKPIDSPDQLTNRETFSRNPWEHTFGHGDRAKKMYYSLRYLTRDGASHWSDVREVVIP
ncbi:MAG: hypothetical protein LBG73_01185 [Spirochaetaceae bacterium]|jgi:hypothetical protein|nr:hypothetical protein [Spirochaetaceae bacterium]